MCLSISCPLLLYPSTRYNPWHAGADDFPSHVEWRSHNGRDTLAYADGADGGPYFGLDALCVVYGRVLPDYLFCQPFGDAIQATGHVVDIGKAQYRITLGFIEEGPFKDCFDQAIDNLVVVQNEIVKGTIIWDCIRGTAPSWKLSLMSPIVVR